MSFASSNQSTSSPGNRDGVNAPVGVMPFPVLTSIPGRARIKVQRLHQAKEIRQKLHESLLDMQGIHKVDANIVTANVLVVYDPQLPLEQVVRAIMQILGVAHAPAIVDDPPESSPEADDNNVISLAKHLRRQVKNLHVSGSSEWHEQVSDQDFHTRDLDYLLRMFSVSVEKGLSHAEVERRLAQYGANVLPEEKGRTALSIIISQFMSLPVGLLGASAVISVLTGGLADALAIMSVVGINAAIGYFTENQAEKTINALKSITPTSAIVLRDGKTLEIDISQIVVGDILVLTPGSYIAADARLLHSNHLMMDESALTGESMPVAKDEQFLGKEDTALADRQNMVYMGTMVTGGSGIAMVVATGMKTIIGQIQGMVSSTRPPETPMQIQLDRLGTKLAILSGGVCAGVFGIGVLRGMSTLEMLKTSISLAVAAVPEGLPAVATTALALGIQDMRKRKVAVRHIDAVETLGAVQVFCLDKTGTLTVNRMSAVQLYTNNHRIAMMEGDFIIDGGKIEPGQLDEIMKLAQVVGLCSDSDIQGDGESATLSGSPTENALLELGMHAGVDIEDLRRRFPRLSVQYRSEGRPYMTTTHRLPGGRYMLAIKGSPEEVLAMCTHYQRDGRKIKLTKIMQRTILRENDQMAGDALRVLGVAYAYTERDGLAEAGEVVWLGLVGMADPLRTGMRDLMGVFHKAGIKTVMITGDQSATAYSIGKQLNLANGEALQIMDSTSLDKMDPELLAGLVSKVHVFSRVSPAHKLQIVQSLQESGYVVAMTGDGINDGPALKAANIGVAMGAAGTDVARSVASVVLEDDNLHTMATAVSEGRTIYNNIRKTVHFLLSTNFSEIEVMLAGVLLGRQQPLNPMQLLWINLITDIFPGLALSMEQAEPGVLEQAPRDPEESIISKKNLAIMGWESAAITAGTLGAYLYALMRYGPGPKASTHAFSSLTLAQLVQAVGCRSETHSIFRRKGQPHNPYLDLAVGGSFFVQLLTTTVPGLRKFLGTTPVGILDSLVIAAGAGLPLLVNEIAKDIRNRDQFELSMEAGEEQASAEDESEETEA